MSRIRPTVLLTACMVGGCARTLPPRATGLSGNGVRLDLLGCYSLRDKRGHPLDSTFYNSTDLVRLDTLPAPATPDESKTRTTGDHPAPGYRGQGYGLMVPLGDRARQIRSGTDGTFSWRLDSVTDTLELSFIDGFSGAKLRLDATPPLGDTLRGRIAEHWDLGPSENDRGAASAIRVRC